MSYKLYIGPGTWKHHKNEVGLNLFIKNNYFIPVSNPDEAQIILYMSPVPHGSDRITNFNILDDKYKNKLIIMGPHFCVFPTPYLKSLNIVNNNVVFNILSEWIITNWKKEMTNNLPLVALPYPVDIDRFKPDETIQKTNEVFIYIKNRRVQDANKIIQHLSALKYRISVFNYKQKYSEEDYIKFLKRACFGVWIGCNESQGFALQEALASNVPLLVYDVKHMGQEENYEHNAKYCSLSSTVIPYWDERCGEYFYDEKEFEQKLLIFISKLQDYKPREFIMENLDVNSLFNKTWKPLIDKHI